MRQTIQSLRAYLFPATFLLGMNVFSFFVFLPAEQAMTNSHMSMKEVWSILYYITAAMILLHALVRYSKERLKLNLLLLFLASCSLVFWGWRMSQLYCEGCAACG